MTHPEVEEYLVRAFDMLKRDEEEQMEFFNDISGWREKYIMLQVLFIVAEFHIFHLATFRSWTLCSCLVTALTIPDNMTNNLFIFNQLKANTH